MKSKHDLDVERAELVVETNLAKFSTAVDHLEDKIVEERAKVEAKVNKVKNIVNKPKDIMNQVTEKAHDLTNKVTTGTHNLTDRAHVLADPYVDRSLDLGKRFWNQAEANPVPFIIGAAAIFGGMIYMLFSQAHDEETELWGY